MRRFDRFWQGQFAPRGAPDSAPTLPRPGTGNPDFMGICLSEHDYASLRGVRDVKFVHTRVELEEYARCCLETGVKPCLEVWHLGGIWNFNYLAAQGLVVKPYWLE